MPLGAGSGKGGRRVSWRAAALRALKPGGFAIVGTFGPLGPDRCSGLPVSRYSTDELDGAFGRPTQVDGGRENSSNAAMAWAAYISEGPPPMYTATPSVSSSSCLVAPSLTSVCT